MHFLQVAPEESDGQSMFELKRQMVDLKALISALPAMILEFLHPRSPTEPASGSHTLPSEPASGFVETNGATPSTPPTTLSSEDVDVYLKTDGAIFDHLFRYVKSPRDLFVAFERGFAGCPSIDVMDAPGIKYSRWRAGKDRHKKIYDWKVVITAIRNQSRDMEDRERFVGAIHLKYGMKRGGALSSLAKLIRVVNAREKTIS